MTDDKNTVLTTNPIIIDMGRRESRLVRQLKNGKGELLDEAQEIVDEVSEKIAPAAKGVERVFVPVIVIVER